MSGGHPRVVIASYDSEPPLGGQGVYVRGLRAALAAAGLEVGLVAGRGEAALAYRRVTGRGPIDFSLALARDPSPLLAGGTEVVHAQGGPGGVLLPRALPVPVVWTVHHTYRQAYARSQPRRLMSALEARSYRRAAHVLAVSPSTAEAVRSLGVPAGRVEVLAVGVDAERYDRGDSVRDPGRLLFVGRLEPEKGPLEAVAVMEAVTHAVPGTRGVVVGAGSLEAEVRRATAVTGGRVKYLGGLSDAEVLEQYTRAAIVLVPSRYEGLGLVAIEAMAAGCAVVAHDVTGLRDAVRPGGLLVPSGDGAAMLAACRRLIEHPDYREEVAERGRAAARAQHSWAAVARRVREVYAAAAGRGG